MMEGVSETRNWEIWKGFWEMGKYAALKASLEKEMYDSSEEDVLYIKANIDIARLYAEYGKFCKNEVNMPIERISEFSHRFLQVSTHILCVESHNFSFSNGFLRKISLNHAICGYFDLQTRNSQVIQQLDSFAYLWVQKANQVKSVFDLISKVTSLSLSEDVFEQETDEGVNVFWELIWMYVYVLGKEQKYSTAFEIFELCFSCRYLYESQNSLEKVSLLYSILVLESKQYTRDTRILERLSLKQPLSAYLRMYIHFRQSEFQQIIDLSEQVEFLDALTCNLVACSQANIGNTENALQCFAQALQSTSDRSIELVIVYNLGICYLTANRFEDAIDTFKLLLHETKSKPIETANMILLPFDECIEINDSKPMTSALVLLVLSRVYSMNSDYSHALEYFQAHFSELEIKPIDSEYYSEYLSVLLRQPQNLSVVQCKYLLKTMQETNSLKILSFKAELLMKCGQFKECIELCDQITSFISSVTYEHLKEPETPYKKQRQEGFVVDKDIDLEFTQTKILVLQSSCLICLDNLEDAIKILRYSLILNQDNVDLQFNYVLTLLKASKDVQACSHWIGYRFSTRLINVEDAEQLLDQVQNSASTQSGMDDRQTETTRMDIVILKKWIQILLNDEHDIHSRLNRIRTL